MQVEIWSDLVCPWCYLGKRRLEQALERFPHRDRVDIVWRSFELEPDAPADPQDLTSRLVSRYGMSETEAAERHAHMTGLAAEAGLTFRLDIAQHGNTFAAHRVLHAARAAGVESQAKERLLAAYFSEGRAISDPGYARGGGGGDRRGRPGRARRRTSCERGARRRARGGRPGDHRRALLRPRAPLRRFGRPAGRPAAAGARAGLGRHDGGVSLAVDVIGEFERRARDLLPEGAYDFFAGGAGAEDTVAANLSAWRELELRPHVLRDVSAVDLSVEVLGTRLRAPLDGRAHGNPPPRASRRRARDRAGGRRHRQPVCDLDPRERDTRRHRRRGPGRPTLVSGLRDA